MTNDIEIRHLTFVFRFKKQEPFPERILRQSISDMGYDTDIDTQGSPVVGVKENIRVDYTPADGNLFVIFREYGGEDLGRLLDRFETLLFDTIGSDIDDLFGIELRMSCTIWKGENTVRTFKNMYKPMNFENILGTPGVGYSIRIVSSEDVSVSEDDFYDVTVEPYVQNTDYYYAMVIYTKPSIEELALFVKKLSESVHRIIDKIEQES